MPFVLITGAALRIGREIASTFWHAGFDLIIHYHHSEIEAQLLKEELLAEVDSTTSRSIILLKQDLLESDAAQTVFQILHAQKIYPTILINNASCYHRSPLKDLKTPEIYQDLTLNFITPLQLMQEMAKQNFEGQIINLLDQRISKTETNSGTYGLAKKSLKEATELAALEWAPKIRVNAIAPGLVLPPPGSNPEKIKQLLCNIPLQQQTTPQEIAQAALFISQQKNMTGHILFLDGGQHLSPIIQEEKQKAKYIGK